MINDNILMYPPDLNERRYISFDFYAPEFSKDIVQSLLGLVDAAFTAGQGEFEAAAGKVADSAKKGANAFVKIFENSKSRISFTKNSKNEIEAHGDLGTRNVQKNDDTYKGSIFLPLANTLNESMSNNYSPVKGTVANLLDAVGAGEDGIAQKALNEISKFTGTRTLLTNPDKTQLYTGSEPRSLNLSWVLQPNNKEEAHKILDIVRTFKKFSSPETQAAKALLLAPYFCTITFNNAKLDDTLRYNDMVISNIELAYGTSGNMEMFSDGMIKQITLTITLNEIKMKTMEDWKSEDNRKKVRKSGAPLNNLFDYEGWSTEDIEEFQK